MMLASEERGGRRRILALIMLLLFAFLDSEALANDSENINGSSNEEDSSSPSLSRRGVKRDSSTSYDDYDDDDDQLDYDDDGEERRRVFLNTPIMRNVSVVSGERLQIKCKVDAWPNDDMRYDWYFKNEVYVRENRRVIDDDRVSVTNRSTSSKLRIMYASTADTGWYKCEVSNGQRRSWAKAYVQVSFKKAPPHKAIIPKGKCELYRGTACGSYLAGQRIYIDADTKQSEMESFVSTALLVLGDKENQVSSTCKRYAYPAFCYFMFAPCVDDDDVGEGGVAKLSPSSSISSDGMLQLCRRDCEMMKYDICGDELQRSVSNPELKKLFVGTDCSHLTNDQCTSLDLPEQQANCYNGTGTSYRGRHSTTVSNRHCVAWPKNMAEKFPSVSGGHNFCRNPGTTRDEPWCFTDTSQGRKERCDLSKCVEKSDDGSEGKNLAFIIIPSICAPFVIGCIAFAICFCRRNSNTKLKSATGGAPNGGGGLASNNSNNKHSGSNGGGVLINSNTSGAGNESDNNTTSNSTSVSFRKQPPRRVAELNASCVLLIDEMGEGQFGKVYRANVIPNPVFCTNLTVAVKTLADHASAAHGGSGEEDFRREIAVFGELQHDNVACLKAIVMQPSLRCMIFEHSTNGDLHEYVVLRSPQSDFAQPPSTGASSQTSSMIEPGDFINMATQVACGMEYLTSKNFVHRDLAARNVLVGPNNQMKISNLAIVRDPYLSCYYRSPQGGQMLPIRWMAPESLQNWQFSDKSAVWSYGVLLWEMFSYGMQPYCGYSNHEVLDMIGRRQLLDCPDQCPAKVYSLMIECWCGQPFQRPTFKELLVKLQGWEQQSAARMTTQIVQGLHHRPLATKNSGPGQFGGGGGGYGMAHQPQSGAMTSSAFGFNSGPGVGGAAFNFHGGQQQQVTGGYTSSSFMASQQQQQQQQSSSPSFASSPGAYAPSPSVFPPSSYPHYQLHHQQQQRDPPSSFHHQPAASGGLFGVGRPQPTQYRPGPPSHSSMTSSASSSTRSVTARPYYDGGGQMIGGGGGGGGYSPFQGQQRPLSDVVENVDDSTTTTTTTHELKVDNMMSMADSDFHNSTGAAADSEALIKSNNVGGGGGKLIVNDAKKQGAKRYRGDSSDVSTISFHATSCDSGLPHDSDHVIDPSGAETATARTPLMAGVVNGSSTAVRRSLSNDAPPVKTPQTLRKPI